jgi:hypothetical protein
LSDLLWVPTQPWFGQRQGWLAIKIVDGLLKTFDDRGSLWSRGLDWQWPVKGRGKSALCICISAHGHEERQTDMFDRWMF